MDIVERLRTNWDFDNADMVIDECIYVLEKRFMGDMNREDMEVRRCIEDLRHHFYGID